ncbi:MAG: virginiamycin B lyase family protein, partial [Nitrososphaeraceae archaeon]
SKTSMDLVDHEISQFERIGMLIPDFEQFTYYDLPEKGATPAVVSADSDGNIWFGESGANKIGVIAPGEPLFEDEPTVLTQWSIPTDNSDPFHISVRPGTDIVFFTEYQTGKIGRLDPNTNIITEWSLPQGVVRPAGISFDNSGNMFIVAEGSEQILKITRSQT